MCISFVVSGFFFYRVFPRFGAQIPDNRSSIRFYDSSTVRSVLYRSLPACMPAVS